MIILEQHAAWRRIAHANPDFRLDEGRLVLRVSTQTQVLEFGEWLTLPESVKPYAREVSVSDALAIDPATGLLVPEGGVPAYSWLVSRTGADLGMSSVAQPIYAVIAAAVEQFLTDNNLI
jgi:hypothetical protein